MFTFRKSINVVVTQHHINTFSVHLETKGYRTNYKGETLLTGNLRRTMNMVTMIVRRLGGDTNNIDKTTNKKLWVSLEHNGKRYRYPYRTDVPKLYKSEAREIDVIMNKYFFK